MSSSDEDPLGRQRVTSPSTSLPIESTTRSSPFSSLEQYQHQHQHQQQQGEIISTTTVILAATTATTATTIEEEEVMEVVGQVMDVEAVAEIEADWDSKPPARPPGPPQVYYTGLHEHDDEEEDDHDDHHPPAQAHAQATATVVDYDVHPSDLLIEAAPAELLGHDYSHTDHQHHVATATATGTGNVELYPDYRYETCQDDIPVESQQVVTDVDVIESGPMEKATVEAWSASTSGQAHVLIQQQEHEQQQEQEWDAKPAERSRPSDDYYYEQWDTMEAYATASDDLFGTTIIDGEAEVVDISEDVHPAELVGGSEATAEAELVGSDFNTAIGVPSGSQHFHYFESHSHATTDGIIVEESNGHHHGGTRSQPWLPPQEARATLVHPQSEQPVFDVTGGTATVVVMEPSSSSSSSLRSRSDPLPATTVTVLEETSIPALPPGVSFRDHVKSDPYSGPITRVQLPLQDQVFRETSAVGGTPEWVRLPSFGGGESSVLPAPMPMLPPPHSPMHTTTTTTHPVPSRHPIASESSISSRNRSRGSNSSTSDSSVPAFQMVRTFVLFFVLCCVAATVRLSFGVSDSLPPLF